MAQKKTTNLLPRKFRTTPNTKFLNSAVEPLISEPELRRIDGYIGQHVTRSYREGDGYVQESTAERQHYQLEPSLVVKDITTDKTKLTVGYTELLNKLRSLGNTVTNESLLFEQKFYNYHGHFDADKFVNYSQYYWVASGMPAAIISSPNTIYIEDILNQLAYTSANGVEFTNGLLVKFKTATEPAEYQNQEYYVEHVGVGIRLVNTKSLIAPETYINNVSIPYDTVDYDLNGYDSDLNTPGYPEYFVINRSDQAVSAWARCNRWMHIDVIRAIEEYQNIKIDLSQYVRATRPIIEFEADIELFNHGVNFYGIVDLIDTTTTDPLSDAAFTGVENSTIAKLIDTAAVQNSYKIVFTAAKDPDVKNKIYTVRIDTFGNPSTERISLTATSTVLVNNSSLLVLQGSNAARTFVYRDGTWSLAQQKTRVNQPPLFDLFDADGNSYADTAYYPNSTFAGNKLFSYKVGSGTVDAVLDLPLSYRSIGNIGDIQFEDFTTTGTFTYSGTTASTAAGQTKIAGELNSNWLLITGNSFQRQIFEYIAENNDPYVIDIAPVTGQTSIEINVNGTFLNRDEFAYNTTTRAVSFLVDLTVGSFVSIMVRSNQVSTNAYYELPLNLVNNGDNQDISTVTMGQLRNHIVAQYRNYIGSGNSFPGTVSVRDLPQDQRIEGTILQHSAPLPPAMFFLTSSDFDFVASVDQARSTYSFFKKRFLDAASTLDDLDFNDVPAAVDTILDYLNQNRSPDMPYYYSDMVAHGNVVSKITYNVSLSERINYGIESIFDDTVPSGRSVLVYCNGVQLVKGLDYEFDTVRPGITLLRPLPTGSKTLEIRDYASTDGSYIPETPTKMGLWPSAVPEITVDTSFRNNQTVIVGHDGSRTVVLGDIRDDMLLELELRIYNNIKRQFVDSSLDLHEVVPGAFRATGFSLDETNAVLAPYYYRWKSENNLEMAVVNFYKNSDAWTWNYYNQLAKDNSRLTGSWSAVFKYWYDTPEPGTRPWEMLGYSSKPVWWIKKYGPAPYTSGNTLLWDDIRDGRQTGNDGVSVKTNLLFARPGIYSYLPVDSQGQLRTPLDIFVKVFNGSITNAAYVFGMGDPVENSWRRSSDYPFAAQVAMAVLKPARYFAQFAS